MQYETNDPKVTKPFTIIASIAGIIIASILLIIGLILKLSFLLLFGIVFIITMISFFINSQKEIREIENNIKQNE